MLRANSLGFNTDKLTRYNDLDVNDSTYRILHDARISMAFIKFLKLLSNSLAKHVLYAEQINTSVSTNGGKP